MMMMESNDVYIALDTAGLGRRGAADSDRKWAEKLHILSSSLSLQARVWVPMISPVSVFGAVNVWRETSGGNRKGCELVAILVWLDESHKIVPYDKISGGNCGLTVLKQQSSS